MKNFGFLWLLVTTGTQLFAAESYQLLWEKRHYALSMSRQFEEQMWVNSEAALSYKPATQFAELGSALADAVNRYTLFTNVDEQRRFFCSIVINTDLSSAYKARFTTPSGSNVFPVLNGTNEVRWFDGFKLVQSLPNGDAIVQADDTDETYYVLKLGRAVDGRSYRDLKILLEDLKTYTTVAGGTKTVQSGTCVSLTKADKEALLKVRYACNECSAKIFGEMEALKKAGKDKKNR